MANTLNADVWLYTGLSPVSLDLQYTQTGLLVEQIHPGSTQNGQTAIPTSKPLRLSLQPDALRA